MLSLQDQTNRMPSIANPPEKWMPQGTQFTSQLYGILPVNGPDLRYLYIYGTGTPSTSQSPLQLHYCAKSLPIVELEIQRYHSYWHSQFCSGFSFLLDLTHRVWLDLSHCVWLDLALRFWHDSTHFLWLDLTYFPPDSIWLTFNVFIFDFGHIIWVSFQSSFM